MGFYFAQPLVAADACQPIVPENNVAIAVGRPPGFVGRTHERDGWNVYCGCQVQRSGVIANQDVTRMQQRYEESEVIGHADTNVAL